MDEYPDAEDEFEMLHAEEMQMMREMGDFDAEEAEAEAAKIAPSIKRSLSFASPPAATPITTTTIPSQGDLGMTHLDENLNDTIAETKRKRPAATAFEEDLEDFFKDDFVETKKKKKMPLLPGIIGLTEKEREDAEHRADLDLIERIVETRKTMQVLDFLENGKGLEAVERPQHQCRIQRRVPDGAFQAVTTENGGRFYLDKIDDDQWDSKVVSAARSQKASCLLNVPYHQLKLQAEQEQIRQDARRARAMQEAEDSGLDSGVDSDEESNTDTLWVEKYKPKQYLDLLSDEATNRTVLHWVKLWDKLVFGVDKKPKQKEEKKKEFQNDKPFKKFPSKSAPEVIEELDDHNRPQQKVILLCGPPGLGKTTLAHVIARHAGYNVVEMNASDDRSTDTFRTNLENATSMRAVLGADPRPNCLIIDEIDGAPAPSINLLVNILTGKDTGGKKKGKKKEVSTLMQRPVICICNELYTPALRPLRMMALVIQFPPTHSTKLAQRLMTISRKHRLRADLTVLMALCDKTENDIRACLAFLQFLRSTKAEVRLSDVEGNAVGQKDYQRSLFSVWHDMFSIPRSKKKRRANPHELQHENGRLLPMPDLDQDLDNFGEQTSLSARYTRMLRTTQSCGEYEKLTQGWFENYPNIKLKNVTMEPINCGLDWALFTDVVQNEISHSQSWNLMAYLPFACVSYHLLFATYQWPKIQFPTQLSELKQKRDKTQNLLMAMVNEMSPVTRVFSGQTPLVQDILPFLIPIIQPTLRPVNTQLYSKQEKEDLATLIDTMICYNITYTQDRSPDGQYSFNLDPNMEEVVRFPDHKPGKQMSYATRQLISREIDMEKVRRAEAYFVKQKEAEAAKMASKAQKPGETKRIEKAIPAAPKATADPTAVPNHLKKLVAKPVIPTTDVKNQSASGERIAAPKDFFGRTITQPQQEEDKSINNEIVKSDIWFKFKEGYSNAVRRKVKLKDIM